MPFLGAFENLLAFLLVLTPVVFFHELGHYWVARRAGVVVDVFSVGFGPELFGWTDKAGTRWKFSAVPLGGYVKMRGDEDAASNASQGAKHMPGSFAGATLARRMAIVAAGPIANFILGIVLFAGVYMAVGKAFVPATVAEALPDTPAAEAGLLPGDQIRSINGRSIRHIGDMLAIIFESPGRTLTFEIERDGRTQLVDITPESIYSEQLGLNIGRLGVRSMPGEFRQLGLFESTQHAVSDSIHMTGMMLHGLARLVSGNAQSGEVGGPVRIAEFSGDAARQGIVSLVIFVALISINLGLVNLLPIPALDGGHLTFFAIEGVMGRPVPEAVQGILMRVGMAFLLSLMLLVTLFDILRLAF